MVAFLDFLIVVDASLILLSAPPFLALGYGLFGGNPSAKKVTVNSKRTFRIGEPVVYDESGRFQRGTVVKIHRSGWLRIQTAGRWVEYIDCSPKLVFPRYAMTFSAVACPAKAVA